MRRRFSTPVSSSSTAANCPVRLIAARTSAACRTTSLPATYAVPASGLSSVDRMRTVVVLPAPLGPSRASTSPSRDVEVDAVEHGEVAVGLAQSSGDDDGCTHRDLLFCVWRKLCVYFIHTCRIGSQGGVVDDIEASSDPPAAREAEDARREAEALRRDREKAERAEAKEAERAPARPREGRRATRRRTCENAARTRGRQARPRTGRRPSRRARAPASATPGTPPRGRAPAPRGRAAERAASLAQQRAARDAEKARRQAVRVAASPRPPTTRPLPPTSRRASRSCGARPRVGRPGPRPGPVARADRRRRHRAGRRRGPRTRSRWPGWPSRSASRRCRSTGTSRPRTRC